MLCLLMKHMSFEDKVYYSSPRIKWWGIHWSGMKISINDPRNEYIPLEETIKASIAWDMPYSFKEIQEKAFNSPTLCERLYTRSQTVDWLLLVLGKEGIFATYPKYKDITRADLREEIEAFFFRKSIKGPKTRK